MWVNEMMTIWLYGSIFAIIMIVVLLFTMYKPDEYEDDQK
ncbi:hypothetical protein SAMN05421677_10336 [Halobacillus aidingensis]|uniref:Uncharacterized protein n=1 Tax=Halobacillus aidingensis TaxID=240303 RepID=A0A1H0H2V1_HALAD|nr:hypothetical protein SAMN05421677_10336 [Halobacillus aidingensis]